MVGETGEDAGPIGRRGQRGERRFDAAPARAAAAATRAPRAAPARGGIPACGRRTSAGRSPRRGVRRRSAAAPCSRGPARSRRAPASPRRDRRRAARPPAAAPACARIASRTLAGTPRAARRAAPRSRRTGCRRSARRRRRRRVCAAGHARHCVERQRLQLDAVGGAGRQFAEQPVQRVIGADLVSAPGDDDQRIAAAAMRRPTNRSRSSVASSAQCTSSKTTTVGGWCRAMPAANAANTWCAGRRRDEQRFEVAAELGRHVEQRPERPRRGQRFAGAPPRTWRALAGGERFEQRGLADARLAGNAGELALHARGRQRAGESGERLVTLEKCHVLAAARAFSLARNPARVRSIHYNGTTPECLSTSTACRTPQLDHCCCAVSSREHRTNAWGLGRSVGNRPRKLGALPRCPEPTSFYTVTSHAAIRRLRHRPSGPCLEVFT